jgi:hypothetical protein
MMQQPMQQQTKSVEVVPVNTVDEAQTCPMAAGSSILFFARDDSFIAVKTAGVNGQSTFDVYDKRPPAPPEPKVDLSTFVTRDEFESKIASLTKKKEAKE